MSVINFVFGILIAAHRITGIMQQEPSLQIPKQYHNMHVCMYVVPCEGGRIWDRTVPEHNPLADPDGAKELPYC